MDEDPLAPNPGGIIRKIGRAVDTSGSPRIGGRGAEASLWEPAGTIAAAIADLRDRRARTLARMPQEAVVAALAGVAERWRDPAYPPRREAEGWTEPFPFAMVRVSLDSLLDSLTADALRRLIDAEDARDALGYPVVGHVIAGNTPLLAWVSIIRALLVRSASLVKLPSNASASWARAFHASLAEAAPELAACVRLAAWPGGTAALDGALCGEVDLVMAHGGDRTLRELRALCPAGTPLIGYGHRVSFGLVPAGSGTEAAARGFARDVLLYDQGGCLSPQTIFVEGGSDEARAFAATLADALGPAAGEYPLPVRSELAAGAVREARGLAGMEAGTALWEDPALRWTVIARTESAFAPSPTFGVISVQPLPSLPGLPKALRPVAGHLQGCAVAGGSERLSLPGVSRVCAPGELQAPPLGWRQDGRDVLRVLLTPARHNSLHFLV